jgi:hypothetical protein
VLVQGKHRFHSLEGPDVASALEGLSVLAGGSRDKVVSSTPSRLRAARACYDHMAGTMGVSIHDRFKLLGWLSAGSKGRDNAYDLTSDGTKAFEDLGIDLEELGSCAAGSRAHAWIGVSAGLMSGKRWGRPS